jgi:hypothetical protein
MPVVTFAEIVAADITGYESGKSLSWEMGGAVDVSEIAAIGMFCRADRFNNARFNIRFKHSETQCVESSNTTAVRKLQAGLTQIWKESQNSDLITQPLELLNKEAQ